MAHRAARIAVGEATYPAAIAAFAPAGVEPIDELAEGARRLGVAVERWLTRGSGASRRRS
ncbi:MAG TPA: hypothetical protein VM513_05115 [Kofleriaceae bacterium]|jgi:hypothetical protein|nr:hypothetical protein [Kofleriaceae bacterium]